MLKPAQPDLDALIEFSASMPIVRYSVAQGYIDRPIRCRIADEALCHAETLHATRIRVILPSNLPTAIHYNGNAWIARSGEPLAQIQSDIDLFLRSGIRQRAEAAQVYPQRPDRLCYMRHARCDVAELLQIQNIGRLLSAWEEMRKQALASMPYRLALANELRSDHPAANVNRHLVHIVRGRMAAIKAWSPRHAIQQAEQHIRAFTAETNGYEWELQWKHMRLCAKCHPVYQARLAESLPPWRRQGCLSGMSPCCQPFQRGSISPVPAAGMRP